MEDEPVRLGLRLDDHPRRRAGAVGRAQDGDEVVGAVGPARRGDAAGVVPAVEGQGRRRDEAAQDPREEAGAVELAGEAGGVVEDAHTGEIS